ncbi:GNAT family N-acetyltransferase [Erwinia sp. CPCC 100877]|nr:GNAT family N-acetyltransferase [Erwinia sp. CPCC 100877]
MTLNLLIQSQLDTKEQAALNDLQIKLQANTDLAFKLDASFFQENGGRVQHLICRRQGQLVGYAALNTFDPQVLEVTVVAKPETIILEKMQQSWLQFARNRQLKNVLLIVDKKDAFLINYLAATKQYVYNFTEYGMLFSGQRLPEVSELNLEKAVKLDAPSILRLEEDETSNEIELADLEKTFVLRENNEVIASIRIENDRQNYTLYGFVVRADYRGQGLGRQLLTSVLQQLMKQQPLR